MRGRKGLHVVPSRGCRPSVQMCAWWCTPHKVRPCSSLLRLSLPLQHILFLTWSAYVWTAATPSSLACSRVHHHQPTPVSDLHTHPTHAFISAHNCQKWSFWHIIVDQATICNYHARQSWRNHLSDEKNPILDLYKPVPIIIVTRFFYETLTLFPH